MVYVMLARNSWRKGDYAQETFDQLMIDARFPQEGTLLILKLDCNAEDVTVDGMGTVNFPLTADKKRIEVELSTLSNQIEKLANNYDNYIGDKEEFWYTHLDDLIPSD